MLIPERYIGWSMPDEYLRHTDWAALLRWNPAVIQT